MTGTMMMDRGMTSTPTMGGMPMGGMPMGATGTAPNMVMVPRCKMTVTKCEGGMMIDCVCDDANSRMMMQNLCSMMAGGMCSLTCTMNGMTCCTCNMCMGACKVEMTAMGCKVTCTSGDTACCSMIQGCCDCVSACMKAGCACCLMIGNCPVCVCC